MHNELPHVNLPPVVSFFDSKILKLDLFFVLIKLRPVKPYVF